MKEALNAIAQKSIVTFGSGMEKTEWLK